MSTRINADEPKICPDCQIPMAQIKIIDKGHGGGHYSPEYAVEGAKPSLWTGRFPIAGQIAAWMCSQCGRIDHYGVPQQ